MTPQNALAPNFAGSAESAGTDESVTIETRFGPLTFPHASVVRMPRGMLGFADHQMFGLADMPDANLAQFKVLQSMDDPALSFIVLPLEAGVDVIQRADLINACRLLKIEFADSVTLLVVSTRLVGETTQISVNLRAPIVLDAPNRRAWQFVLPNSQYPVRHVIANARRRDG